MRKIIDFHTHLGDIFNGNQNMAFKKRKHMDFGVYPDPFKDLEESGFNRPRIVPAEEAQNTRILAGQYRMREEGAQAATPHSRGEHGVAVTGSLPCFPNTCFEEALAASMLEPRIIPFTSPDFSLTIPEMRRKLESDIAHGAKGMKVHPQIQNINPNDPRVGAAIEVLGGAGLPTLFHFGVNTYYVTGDPNNDITPAEYGALHYCFDILARYPQYPIVVGHAGGNCGGELEELGAELAKHDWPNVYVDTSFKNAETMRRMVELLGEDHVLFGTDYPFTKIKYSIAECEKAFADQPDVLNKVFYANAVRLMHLFED